ncbi:hypothetical protein ACTHQ4_10400 [Alkalicoccobacillus gibsonii]|uniref:hypothetical protein n=1 Tax=Alkalicoccobacillus gibsonii TaxID=79881 RepID=UPI003F7BF0C5
MSVDKHLNHPLYKEARELFGEVQHEQILKGAAKYPEPLNPHSWTPQQLLAHMMQEAVDMVHYGVAMHTILKERDEQLTEFTKEIHDLKQLCEQQKETINRQSVKLNQYESTKKLPPL